MKTSFWFEASHVNNPKLSAELKKRWNKTNFSCERTPFLQLRSKHIIISVKFASLEFLLLDIHSFVFRVQRIAVHIIWNTAKQQNIIERCIWMITLINFNCLIKRWIVSSQNSFVPIVVIFIVLPIKFLCLFWPMCSADKIMMQSLKAQKCLTVSGISNEFFVLFSRMSEFYWINEIHYKDEELIS